MNLLSVVFIGLAYNFGNFIEQFCHLKSLVLGICELKERNQHSEEIKVF